MEEKPLISIIIPVYNVEKYLDECIQSIVRQTYANIEIILVNDGSTDCSGTKCEEWRKKDSRIRVIHKENGGLADARNAGVAIANGEYIGFVDSDDKIECDMYEELLRLCKKYDVPLACARFDVFGLEDNMEMSPETGKEEVLSAHDLLEIILWPWVDQSRFASISVWDRLYRKDIIADLLFPKGKVFEDIVYSTKAIIAAKRVAYINKVLYHYRIREESITGNRDKLHPKRMTDQLSLEKEQVQIFEAEKLRDLEIMDKFNICMNLYRLKFSSDDAEERKHIQREVDYFHLRAIDALRYIPGIRQSIKTAIKVFFFAPYVKIMKMK